MLFRSIELEDHRIQRISDIGQPFCTGDHTVEAITMQDQHALALRGHMHMFITDLDAAKIQADKLTNDFVMISRYEYDFGTFFLLFSAPVALHRYASGASTSDA